MGSIFGDPVYSTKQRTTRQRRYLSTRKTDRKRNQKNEQALQIALCDWMRHVLPGVHFRSDTGSGAFNSAYEKDIHNRQQSTDSEPDLMIFAARHGYHGLLIELKAEGVKLKKSRDGTKIIVRKDARGRIIERDYKIRMKGDWATLHIEKQAKVLEDYRTKWGYFACFAVGEEQAKNIITRYFGLETYENTSIF